MLVSAGRTIWSGSKKRFRRRMGWRITQAGVALFLVSGWTVGEARQEPRSAAHKRVSKDAPGKGGLNFWSPEHEIELGRSMAREAAARLRLSQDEQVTAYVTAVAHRIARNSDAQLPITVRVVDSDEVDAFVLPGGHLFLTTGAVLEAETEAELASFIAHEIGHIAARHMTRQMSRIRLWNLISIPLMLAGGPVAYGIQQGAALALPFTLLKFSRNAEMEADRLGFRYHAASGYDPVSFVDFLERVKRKSKSEKGGIARAFATHPMTRDRIRAAERWMEQDLPVADGYVVTTWQHDQIRQRLGELRPRPELVNEEEPVLRTRIVGAEFPRRSPDKQEGKKRCRE